MPVWYALAIQILYRYRYRYFMARLISFSDGKVHVPLENNRLLPVSVLVLISFYGTRCLDLFGNNSLLPALA